MAGKEVGDADELVVGVVPSEGDNQVGHCWDQHLAVVAGAGLQRGCD